MIKTIHPYQIADLLDEAPEGIRTLSLDCFDTLIWRATHMPEDVFAELDFPGGGIEPRLEASEVARQLNMRNGGTGEVSIEEVHNQLPTGAEAGVAAEFAIEARHCFAFAPTVDLVRSAKARGLQVVIVTDTYFSESQLRTLIATVAGDDLMGMIDRIFCSSKFGYQKGTGMFAFVLHALQIPPEAILHIGDNPLADGIAAAAAGIHAVRIEQFSETVVNRLRLEAAAAVIFDPATRVTRPAMQPHRAAIAAREDRDFAWELGHDVFGPLLDAFSRWLKSEIQSLEGKTGRPVKPLFLLRDGFLPLAMFEAIGGRGSAVSISRFTARRASLSDAAAVSNYLDEAGTERVDVLARQLGLTVQEAARIGTTADQFRKAVMAPDVIRRITTRSTMFAKRLAAHIRREASVAPGDVAMFVDLGYHGTVQDLAGPVLEDQLGVTITGRYLLLTSNHNDRDHKRGMLDSRHYDNRMLLALSRQISIVEQVATSNKGSVVDYADNGRSKHKPCLISPTQASTRALVQDGALSFARTANDAFHRPPKSDDLDARRQMALAILGRLLFVPQPEEVAVFAQFQHDVNLGTDDLVGLVDYEKAKIGLRRRGLPYLRGANRMFLPGELRAHGLPLTLSNVLASRFELDIRTSDFVTSALTVPVFFAHQNQQITQDFSASPTHDGFYSVTIPIGRAKFDAGIQIGALGQIVQLEELAFYTLNDLASTAKTAPSPIAAEPIFDEMESIAENVWRCSERSLLFVPPPPGQFDEALVLSMVFRPVVASTQTAVVQPTANRQSVSA